jgi:hypothetical protein
MPIRTGRWAGRIDQKAYDSQVTAAIEAAQPYISFLEQSGDTEQADAIKAGHIPKENLEVLEAIAKACKVHLVLLDQKSDGLREFGDLEHQTVFLSHSKLDPNPEHFDLLLPDADHEQVLLLQLQAQRQLWQETLLNLVLKYMLLHCPILALNNSDIMLLVVTLCFVFVFEHL